MACLMATSKASKRSRSLRSTEGNEWMESKREGSRWCYRTPASYRGDDAYDKDNSNRGVRAQKQQQKCGNFSRRVYVNYSQTSSFHQPRRHEHATREAQKHKSCMFLIFVSASTVNAGAIKTPLGHHPSSTTAHAVAIRVVQTYTPVAMTIGFEGSINQSINQSTIKRTKSHRGSYLYFSRRPCYGRRTWVSVGDICTSFHLWLAWLSFSSARLL